MPDDVDPLGDPAGPDVPLYALGALVYAERDDQILLLRRAGGVLSGQWYLPGGGVEAGETPEQGAVRELIEESGLSPDGDEHHEAMWITPQAMRDVITDDFIAELASGNTRVGDLVHAIRDDLDRYLRLRAV